MANRNQRQPFARLGSAHARKPHGLKPRDSYHRDATRGSLSLRPALAIGRMGLEALEQRVMLSISALASLDAIDAVGQFVIDGNGNIYGADYNGGPNRYGTIFEIAKGSGTVTTLASFDFTDGSGPEGVAVDAIGNVYGSWRSPAICLFRARR